MAGTGPGGEVTRHDVEAAAARAAEHEAVPWDGYRPRVSPYARRLADELGVELADVTGTGPGGAVRAEDVRTAAGPGCRARGSARTGARAPRRRPRLRRRRTGPSSPRG